MYSTDPPCHTEPEERIHARLTGVCSLVTQPYGGGAILNTETEYSCRIVSQQFGVDSWDDFRVGDILYSPRVPLAKADALLVLYDPSDELLRFSGPKLWFTIEPSWHHHFHSHPVGKRLVRELDASERAFYGHPDATHRVPHPTHSGTLSRPRVPSVRRAAVATVNNFGGRLWFLKSHFRTRNRMILDRRVELFGKPDAWANFRHFPKLWIQKPPDNYAGKASPGAEIDGDDKKIRFLSGYKVAVCLENCTEAYYFTEKFINAVRAGCIPVYHAHATVKNGFLSGARWIDPAEFGFSSRRTIEFALDQDQSEFRSVNDAWLESGILADTDDLKVFPKLHEIVSAKLRDQNARATRTSSR